MATKAWELGQTAAGNPVATLPGVERLTTIILAAMGSQSDPRTVEMWSRCAARSPGTIREWCRAAGVRPKDALDFARLLRALTLARAVGLRIEDTLDVIDCRTLASLLRRGGLQSGAPVPDLDVFLEQQQLITRAPIVLAIGAAAPRVR